MFQKMNKSYQEAMIMFQEVNKSYREAIFMFHKMIKNFQEGIESNSVQHTLSIIEKKFIRNLKSAILSEHSLTKTMQNYE